METKNKPGDINWITDYLHVDFKNKLLESVLAFLLYWNTFEARLFERNFRSESVRDDEINIHIEDEIVSDSFEFAKQRYVSPIGTLNTEFKDLGFRNLSKNKEIETEDEKYVREVLLTDSPVIQNRLNAMIIIIYRLRNNLFHGEKSIQKALRQTDLLNWACRILGECISQNDEDSLQSSV